MSSFFSRLDPEHWFQEAGVMVSPAQSHRGAAFEGTPQLVCRLTLHLSGGFQGWGTGDRKER